MGSLVGPRVSLRPVTAEDGEAFVARARDSVALHRHLIYAPTTLAEFAEYLTRFDGADAVGFLVRLNATGEPAGLVNLNGITRHPVPSASLGFGGFAATSGHGYVAEGVRLAVAHAFEELRLVRLEADVQPANTASRKVVEQAGFTRCPATRTSIRIGGEWRVHDRWVLLADHGHSHPV